MAISLLKLCACTSLIKKEKMKVLEKKKDQPTVKLQQIITQWTKFQSQ